MVKCLTESGLLMFVCYQLSSVAVGHYFYNIFLGLQTFRPIFNVFMQIQSRRFLCKPCLCTRPGEKQPSM